MRLLLAAWLGFLGSLGADVGVPVILTLSTRDPAYPEIVTIRLENQSGHDIYWLDWWMPDNGKVRNKLLTLRRISGQESDYIGIFASYGTPARSDYVLLKKGANVEETVDLTKSYRLEWDTDYEAVIDRTLEYYDSANPDEAGRWTAIKSNSLKLRLEPSLWQRIRRWWTTDS